MTTIYSINADGRERYDSVSPERVAKQIKMLKNQGQLNVRVVPEPSQTPVPQLEPEKKSDVEVAPGIFQSIEDYRANHEFDEYRDNLLQDQLNQN